MSILSKLNNEMSSKTWSLTVGNGGENHTGMEFLGSLRNKGEGWDINKLNYGKKILEDIFGKKVDLYNLNELCLEGVEIEESKRPKDAYLMVVRDFLGRKQHKAFIKEMESYDREIIFSYCRMSPLHIHLDHLT